MQSNEKKRAASGERSVNIARIFRVIFKRAWILVLVASICALLVFGYVKTSVDPVYRSNFTAYVNNQSETAQDKNNMTTADISASRNLTYLYEELILTRSVLMDAAKACNMNVSYKTMLKNVETSVSNTAAIINVTVTAKTPQEAKQLADAISVAAKEHVSRVVKGSEMVIVDVPLEGSKYTPSALRYALTGFAIALVLGCIVVIVADAIVDKVGSAEELEDRYNITVIGMIPDMQQADKYQYTSSDKAGRK